MPMSHEPMSNLPSQMSIGSRQKSPLTISTRIANPNRNLVNPRAPWSLPFRFKDAIQDSANVLRAARRGISIFESENFKRGA